MSDFPHSLIAFQRRCPDEASCAASVAALRWPDGFRCPGCGHDQAWRLDTKAWTYQCKQCRRQTSVTAGTIMHGSKVSLSIWLWAAYLMATHSNGISAFQLWKQLGLGSYKTAWLLCAKLRHAMVDPDRNPLFGLVEIDETTIHHRTKDSAICGGRIRLAAIKDFSATSLHGFIATNIAPASTAKTDGWSAYPGAPGINHDPRVIGAMAAHVVLPWIHRVFSNLKTWALGVYHGLRPKHLQSYLDEFTFRFNRRRTRPAAFRSLLRVASRRQPVTYKMLIAAEATG